MKTIIQKVDLDTTLTALIMGVGEADEVVVLKSEASSEDLHHPEVLCIEAGGSGQRELNNFDHHNTEQKLPPACRQAYAHQELKDKKLQRLVDYVCMVDENSSLHPAVEFPSLSNIFSGMLLGERNLLSQLFKGLGILKEVLAQGIDPFRIMPEREEWRDYKEAKRINREKVEEVIKKAEFFASREGLKIAYGESDFIGGLGALYAQGAEVVIMYNPNFGHPPYPKFTIAGNNLKVFDLLKIFDKIEPGWGGRETIIGSPRNGSRLSLKEVVGVVRENL